ncbi:MAG: PhzF family phenazine biosynthesis protein [Solirubrobacterales bacterium]|nr:PhzF family phenazine biosynthesis protein [Solirubrobacterales bacterium]
MPDGHHYEIWDVFTDTPLEGNPLGVFPHGEEIPSRLYQKLARELNLSETVFILGDQIRIFTPVAELPFAGHPTLGAAFVVAERDGRDVVTLQTGAGPVVVTVAEGYGEMDQPYPSIEPFRGDDAELLAALGVKRALAPIESYTNGPTHTVVVLDDVASLRPDMGRLEALGVQLSAVASTGAGTAKLRMFAPALGVAEDPATGSAAGPVALHLVRHGLHRAGTRLELTQGVEIGRPSTLIATATEGGPVKVGGGAVRVATGHYRVA